MSRSKTSIGRRVGLLLREARLGRNLPLSEVASKAGIPIPSLSMLESGVRSERFQLDKLRLLALAVGYDSLADLIVAAEDKLDAREVVQEALQLIAPLKRASRRKTPPSRMHASAKIPASPR